MSDFGIKITKDDKKVDSDDSLDYVLNSKYPNIFTAKAGTSNYLFNDSSYGVGSVRMATIPHKLGYTPSYLVYLTDDAINYTFLDFWYFSRTAWDLSWGAETWVMAHCDKQNLYIDFVKTAQPPDAPYYLSQPPSNNTAWKDMAGISFNFKYYIFANEVN